MPIRDATLVRKTQTLTEEEAGALATFTADVSKLFTPLRLRGTSFRNRAWVSPMCQYTSVDGRPGDWHLVHLGSMARGGAGLVMTEATAVTPEGRISPQDAGIWTDEQAADYRRITDFIRAQGAVAGIQLAHAGRKGSTRPPWLGGGPVDPVDSWTTVSASSLSYADWPAPHALTEIAIRDLLSAWTAATIRAAAAGFEVIEIHAAHGYLLHQFLSPLSNRRTDGYGGDLAGRSRLLVEAVDAVRAAWPDERPLFVRLSASDWVEGGLDVNDVTTVAKELAGHGVDLYDVSSGGISPDQQVAVGPGYQVPFARAIREGTGLRVAAVGLITEPAQAEQVLADGAADAVMLARALLREPSWPQRAARELGDDISWPPQYERARL
ncbi:MAG: NADH:flavin oxidoreductase/NADH oxidase [Nocardioidaceae bacterium]